MAKDKNNKVEAETKVDPKVVAVMKHLADAVGSLTLAETAADAVGEGPIVKRINKLGNSLFKSAKYIEKQLTGLAGKAEKAAAKENRVMVAEEKKIMKLEKMVKQQKKLAERIAKMQEAK